MLFFGSLEGCEWSIVAFYCSHFSALAYNVITALNFHYCLHYHLTMNFSVPGGINVLALLKLPHTFYQVKLSQAISFATVAGQMIDSEKDTQKHTYGRTETEIA